MPETKCKWCNETYSTDSCSNGCSDAGIAESDDECLFRSRRHIALVDSFDVFYARAIEETDRPDGLKDLREHYTELRREALKVIREIEEG